MAGAQPEHYRQLFASIQTLNNQLADLSLSADYYDYIVIDEVHHRALAFCVSREHADFMCQQFLHKLAVNDFTLTAQMHQRMAVMCHYDFWQKPGSALDFSALADSLKALNHSQLKAELVDVVAVLINRIRHEQFTLVNLAQNPLKAHARYTREQVLAGFAVTTFDYQNPAREGVLMIAEQNIELLFMTLNKNEKQFSPTTMYHDYAINEQLFHWQSQNSAGPETGKGLNYIEHQQTGKRLFIYA